MAVRKATLSVASSRNEVVPRIGVTCARCARHLLPPGVVVPLGEGNACVHCLEPAKQRGELSAEGLRRAAC